MILIKHQKIPLSLPQIFFFSTGIQIEPQNIYSLKTLNWSLHPQGLNHMIEQQNLFSHYSEKKTAE